MDTTRNLPAYVRWPILAAIGITVLAVVESLETGDISRLTSVGASQAMLSWAVPILLAGLGGLFSERAGIVNIGLEGMMILGTWFGAWGVLEFGSVWWGLVIGMLGGAFGGLLHAVATVSFGVDHIISGVAINLIAPGMARFLSEVVFENPTQSPNVGGLPVFNMPVLAGGGIRLPFTDQRWSTPDLLGNIDDREIFIISDLAGFTRGLMSGMSVFTLIALALVPVVTYVIWRTPFGLRLRISGERPEAGESLGVNIYLHKYFGVVISGAMAGLGGAFIAQELNGFFQEGQTTGRGFIGLAALIFGNWRPSGILFAALLFGYPFGTSLIDLDNRSTHALMLVIALGMAATAVWTSMRRKWFDTALALALAIALVAWYLSSDTAPTWLPNVMPYALVILVLVFASQRLRPPAAVGLAYRKSS